EFELKPLTPIRRAIAARVTESFHDIPQFDLHLEADASALKAVRARYKAAGDPVVPGYNDMVMFTCSRVLERHRGLNAHYTVEGIKVFSEVNVGFAVATGQGVLLPVIRRAGVLGLEEISARAAGMSELAREMKLRASLQMHATFTVSSLGGFGIDSFNAVLSPPQVAILATGAVIEKPVARDGRLATAPVMHLTLTVDHRAVDGAEAAAFLTDLKQALEKFDA
ncbi:MAG: 2-oxo acid dehydrogenase subunit E2, partial [Gemmatimonadota bacterium]|nr:2-oxo acid dehydrogenase subunit E2 [Gemmatimonadota bacterium]